MALYEIAILGAPTNEQVDSLKQHLAEAADQFKLKLGDDISIVIHPHEFRPNAHVAAAAVFFGGTASVDFDIGKVLDCRSIPILPVASSTRPSVRKSLLSCVG